jgi:cbb3-type cytochrome oxidase maturation protein
MIPYSIAVALTGLLLGLLAIGAFAWAWRRGAYDDIDEQARVILDPRDYRLIRPWETPAEQEERRRLYGELIEPVPGEWGGAD